MNDYTKQLEETNAKQAAIIDTLRKVNEELVEKYNKLADRYNQVADMLNACGVRETQNNAGERTGWALTMQIGGIPDPTTPLKEKGIDTKVTMNPVKQDGDKVVWGI
jgi:uncharacterized protein YlxW (UPF0749 family)